METDFQTKITASILKILANKGMSQAELARRTSLDAATVSKIFSGQTSLKVNALSEISTALGMSVIDVLAYPDKYVLIDTGIDESEPLDAVLQIRLSKDKRDQIMRLLFGERGLEILNK